MKQTGFAAGVMLAILMFVAAIPVVQADAATPQRFEGDERPRPEPFEFGVCKPDYPRASLLAGEQGTVRLAITLDAKGHITKVRVSRSSGFRRLDQAVVRTFSHCPIKFEPGRDDNGKPVRSTIQNDYKFTIPD